jgi:hypothetical protein
MGAALRDGQQLVGPGRHTSFTDLNLTLTNIAARFKGLSMGGVNSYVVHATTLPSWRSSIVEHHRQVLAAEWRNNRRTGITIENARAAIKLVRVRQKRMVSANEREVLLARLPKAS